MNFYDLKTAPKVFDIVWCKWPGRGDKLGPGPWIRCVLVLDVRLMLHEPTNTEYAAITATYGTGAEHVDDVSGHLLVPTARAELLGLHKATVFKLDVGNRLRLPWAEEYFVPQGYVQSQGIIAGSLSKDQQATVLDCLKKRGLAFPLP